MNLTQILLTGVISLIVINCGQVSTRETSRTLGSNENDIFSQPDPIFAQGPAFNPGDAFSPDQTPYMPIGPVADELQTYGQVQGFKAIAFAPSGHGYAGGDGSFASQDEANEVILERCQLRNNNQPCALFVANTTVVHSHTEFYDQHRDVLESGARNFDPNTIPGLAFQWRDLAAGGGYVNRSESFKAYAISSNGTTSPGWSNASQSEASRRALEFCETIESLPCTLYAEGDSVIFSVLQFAINMTPSLLFAPSAFDPNNVPFITDEQRNDNMVAIAARIANGENIVVTLSPFGHFDNEAGPVLDDVLIQASLNDCNGRLPADSTYQCFVYSQNDQVVMTQATLRQALLANSQ